MLLGGMAPASAVHRMNCPSRMKAWTERGQGLEGWCRDGWEVCGGGGEWQWGLSGGAEASSAGLTPNSSFLEVAVVWGGGRGGWKGQRSAAMTKGLELRGWEGGWCRAGQGGRRGGERWRGWSSGGARPALLPTCPALLLGGSGAGWWQCSAGLAHSLHHSWWAIR